jgi:hypothetical protein
MLLIERPLKAATGGVPVVLLVSVPLNVPLAGFVPIAIVIDVPETGLLNWSNDWTVGGPPIVAPAAVFAGCTV